ncbi:hypothetical protein Dimus_020943, partial [Dionaea muscipula]
SSTARPYHLVAHPHAYPMLDDGRSAPCHARPPACVSGARRWSLATLPCTAARLHGARPLAEEVAARPHGAHRSHAPLSLDIIARAGNSGARLGRLHCSPVTMHGCPLKENSPLSLLAWRSRRLPAMHARPGRALLLAKEAGARRSPTEPLHCSTKGAQCLPACRRRRGSPMHDSLSPHHA